MACAWKPPGSTVAVKGDTGLTEIFLADRGPHCDSSALFCRPLMGWELLRLVSSSDVSQPF